MLGKPEACLPKERECVRLRGGKDLAPGGDRWRTSSLNLALEPRTPPVWTCARWIASIRRRVEPMTAIFVMDDLPEKWNTFIEINKNYVDGGKFQPDKYQKTSS
jgi:hypothetical protein